MKNRFKYVILLLTLVVLSCNKNEKKTIEEDKIPTTEGDFKREFQDNFEDSLQPFWFDHQFTDPSRLSLVKDPLDKNKVLRIDLKVEDYIAGGYRSELVVRSKDSFGYINNLSVKFLFPKSFFKKEKKNGIIVIQQWHDEPYPGFSWKTNKNKIHPPQGLYVKHDTLGNFNLVFKSGLKGGKMYEIVLAEYEENLKPNIWYTFSLETFWSLYSKDGYFKPRINGKCFKKKNQDLCKIYGRNMYHTIPNYYKMGIYRSGTQENDRFMFFDDFNMVTKRISYFTPNL